MAKALYRCLLNPHSKIQRTEQTARSIKKIIQQNKNLQKKIANAEKILGRKFQASKSFMESKCKLKYSNKYFYCSTYIKCF